MLQEDLEALPKSELIRQIEELNFRQNSSQSTGACLRTLAKILFAGLIVSIPFRYRTVLLEIYIPPIYRDYTDVLFFTSDLFLLATLAVWAGSFLSDRRKLKFGPVFLTVPILLLPLIGLLSTPLSVAGNISLYNTIRLILLVGLYFYVLNEIRSLDELVIPVGIQVFIQSTIAIGQVLRQTSIGLRFLGELDLNPEMSGISVVYADGVRSLRAYGLSDHPNILGGSLALGLLFLMIVYPRLVSSWKLVFTGLFALGSLALLLTFSRSAWLAFAFGAALLIFLQVKNHLKQPLTHQLSLLLSTAVVLVPFIWYYAPLVGTRLNYRGSFNQIPQEQQAIGERTLLIQSANEIFARHPFTGVGLAAFPVALMQARPQFPVDYQPAHFVLLEVAAETGIFGGLVYFFLMVAPWLVLWLNRRKIVFSIPLIGVTSLLLAVTVIGFFDYYTWLLAPGRLWQWLIWGLWGAIYTVSLPGGEP